MKYQTRNRLEHGTSFFISVIVNSFLLVAMLHFITMEPDDSSETTTVMVIEEDEFVEIDDPPEEEIFEDPVEMTEFRDPDLPTFETEIETNFEVEPEVVQTPTETNVNELSQLLSDIVSPVQMTNLMPGRSAAARQALVNQYSGGHGGATEAAVRRALDWLVSVQLDDGSWHRRGETGGRNGSTGTTGLGLLTFLSNGQTPSSAEYGETVAKAIRYLVESQRDDGMILRSGSGSEVYAHAMAAYALAEAYTMTNNRLLREPVQKAARVIIEGMMADGGFPGAGGGRYTYGRSGSNDASVGGWNIQALKAIQIASRTHNLNIPGLDSALQKAMDGMLLNAAETDSGNMTIGYTSPGNRDTVTAAGGLAMHLAGRANARDTRRILGHLRQFEPEWGNAVITTSGGEINHWYYTIQAFFHSDPNGRDFRRYNNAVATALVRNQHESGRWDCFTGRQGPLFDTTLAALSLMVYYRYLPTTQADQIQALPQQQEQMADDDIITITL